MALYDPNIDGAPLALLTLPVLADQRPLPALQPPLTDGIHLRWAFSRDRDDSTKDLGFPWYGFYLFRRLTLGGSTVTTICAASQFSGLTAGPHPSPELPIALGTFRSDQNLVLTDDFPAAATVELDLSGRSFIDFEMDPNVPNRNVNVTIGFVADFPPIPPSTVPPGTPGSGGTGLGSSGLGGAGTGASSCGCGCDHAAIQPFVDRVIALGGGQYRATFGYENTGTPPVSMPIGPENRFFPDPENRGQPTQLLGGRHSGAFSVVFDGRPITWRLAGSTVTVSAADLAGTGGGGGGPGGGGGGTGGPSSSDGILVTVFSTGGAVDTRVVSGRAGEVVTVSIPFEGIVAVRLSSGPARLIDICATRTTDGRGDGWAPVPGLTQPICLPVFDPQYPCNPGTRDEVASRELALDRIKYGNPSDWGDQVFHSIHETLIEIVNGGPNKGITDAQVDLVADPDPADPDAEPPQITQLSSLDMLLGAAVNPAMAQLLGLYFIDESAVEGQTYDYTLVADYNNAGGGDVAAILALVTAENYTNITAYQRIGVTHGVSQPLAPPRLPVAYSLPVGGVPANVPGDVAGQVGVRWEIPTMSDTNTRIRSDAAILFHVWRKDFGRSLPISSDDSSEFHRITDFEISAGQVRAQAPDPILSGWPPVSLFAVDGPLLEGWYAYRVSGIDIFGRYSALSGSAPWVNAGVIEEGDANRAVHIMDTTPPPAPTGVQAWLLDPLDPFVIQDTAYDNWRDPQPPLPPPPPGRNTVIGLRVRWQWTGKQMRQAPDTKEFRIYVKAGSVLDQSALVTNWDRRIAVVGIGEQMLNEVLAPALTSAPVNLGGQSATAAGAVVTLADGEPLDEADPNDGLELELLDATGDRTRFTVVAIDANARTITLAQTPTLADVSSWTLGPMQLRGQSATAVGVEVTLTDTPPLVGVPIDALELDLPAAGGGRTRFAVLEIDVANKKVKLDAAPQLSGSSAWTLGIRERTYEVFLPGAPLAAPLDFVLPASPSPQTAVVYALVGVTAAGDKDSERAVDIFAEQPQHPDTVLVPRKGNEGAVGGPMTIVQVLRTTPDAPGLPSDQATLSATRADFNSRSFFNLHFPKASDLFTHVYRALDETLFAVDSGKRFPTPPQLPTADNPSTVTPASLGWGTVQNPDQNRFNAAASEIANLTATTYGTLQPDALRLLASLPSNAEAFSCLTATPLDPATPDTQAAHDFEDNYQLDPNASAYLDTLDGRASNRYFYRTAKVNRANTAGKLGVSTPPVKLPPTAVPEAPRLATALGGDRSIALSILAVADPGVVSYRIYRADSSQAAGDIRTMQPIATVSDTRAITERPNPLPVPPDVGIVPYHDYFYRATAILPAGAESPASAIMSARAFDDSPPPEPTWERSEWVKLDAAGGEHPFTDTDPALKPAIAIRISFASTTVVRALIHQLSGNNAQPVSSWLAPLASTGAGTRVFATYLQNMSPTTARTLRSRAVTQGGREDVSAPREIPAP